VLHFSIAPPPAALFNRRLHYAGFGWKKSEQFQSSKAWQEYLSEFALKLSTPLRTEIK